MNTKQVLVWRTDLRNVNGQKVRSGKMAVQLAHASMKAILNEAYYSSELQFHEVRIQLTPEMENWLCGLFTKVCVGVNSEEELLNIYNKAKEAGLHCSLIQDAGLTEFGGVPTYTAVAVGPGFVEEIDKITGTLSLL